MRLHSRKVVLLLYFGRIITPQLRVYSSVSQRKVVSMVFQPRICLFFGLAPVPIRCRILAVFDHIKDYSVIVVHVIVSLYIQALFILHAKWL